MLKKIISAFLVGFLGTLFYAQYDSWTHKKVIGFCQKISHDYLGGNFSAHIHSLSFFSPSLTFHDIEMKSRNNDWSWRCKKCEISCSWIQLLLKGIMDQHIVVEGFECFSRVQGTNLAIEQHCRAMMQQSLLPFSAEIKSIQCRNAGCIIEDSDAQISASFSFNSSSLRIGTCLKTTLSVSNGCMLYESNPYIEQGAADISVVTRHVNDVLDVEAHIAGTCLLSHMGERGACYVSGSWKSDRGRFSVRNAHNSLMIDPIIVTESEIRLNGRFPLSYAMQCFRNSHENQMVNGTVQSTIKMARDTSGRIDGQVVLEDVMIKQHHVCDTSKVVFARTGNDWRMKLGFNRRTQECVGTAYWEQDKNKGELALHNTSAISALALPYWSILQNNLYAHINVENNFFEGQYRVVATNKLRNISHAAQGSCAYKEGVFNAQGMLDENEYSFTSRVIPEVQLMDCSYTDKEHNPLITLKQISGTENKVEGMISFSFVRGLINSWLHYDLQGEGALAINATIKPEGIEADLALNDTTIRLPQTYNFIDGFSAHCVYDSHKRSCVLENINLSLHTGTVSCLRASAFFDKNGTLFACHAPVLLDRCLLNVKKDLFAIVSGNLLFSKIAPSPARVSGHIIIDKAQLKENLFSGIIQKQLLSYTHSAFSLPDVPVQCDLTIETKSPIKVDTAFLQTNAKVNLHIAKDMHDPSVIGSVILNSGTLNFPYKPLYITKGIITFSPEQLLDPTIELVARNKIKKYDVSLQVEGTLTNHHIVLDSTPPLSEEQIVGLLLVGSEENTLNSMMPALIVQNLKNLIFTNNQSTFLDKYFKPILRTFNINLVPSFTDQTGRGGLRGALEITVDDRWRAVIQKNFSLTEDTKFELEFLMSDDITLRAIRDERRDLGGEVEMRWKF